MNETSVVLRVNRSEAVRSLILDLIAIAFVFFVPALSHRTGFPIYLVEPMRIMVILALLHSHRLNAWALAVVLPAFSYFVSGHPLPLKMGLITLELLVNVCVFQWLSAKINPMAAMVIAITTSKIVYYLLKFGVVTAGWLQMELFATPIAIQVVTTLIFSGYAGMVFTQKNSPKKHI